jgi:hypothetical protein
MMNVALGSHHLYPAKTPMFQATSQDNMRPQSSITQSVDRGENHSHLKSDSGLGGRDLYGTARVYKFTELLIEGYRMSALSL